MKEKINNIMKIFNSYGSISEKLDNQWHKIRGKILLFPLILITAIYGSLLWFMAIGEAIFGSQNSYIGKIYVFFINIYPLLLLWGVMAIWQRLSYRLNDMEIKFIKFIRRVLKLNIICLVLYMFNPYVMIYPFASLIFGIWFFLAIIFLIGTPLPNSEEK